MNSEVRNVTAGSEVTELVRYGPGQSGVEGSILKAAFTVGGQSVLCTDSVVQHAFTFTPAISFFVACESEEEIVRLSSALSSGGSEFMPLGDLAAPGPTSGR